MTRFLLLGCLLAASPAWAQEPISFRRDVISAINVGGCNSGACHGSPNGRGGFKLSLRGCDPEADYQQLTRDLQGRRVNPAMPGASLILQKPLLQVSHEGGARFDPDSVPARVFAEWIQQGCRDDGKPAITVKELKVHPGDGVLMAPIHRQQLKIQAVFADGATRDVTPLTVFTSNDAIAQVSLTGMVEFSEPGEVAILCRYLDATHTIRLTHLQAKPGFTWTGPAEKNVVDTHVFAKLKHLQILPSDICSDTAFLRRVTLDLCGILPTKKEVEDFLADRSPTKRAQWIDRLLERPDHADFWTLKWLDVLRNSRKSLGADAAGGYRAWVRQHVAANTPLDRMVRELLTAQGSTVTIAPANYFRVDATAEELAETTAQLFCGVRIQCAQCHNHPWESWTQDDYFGMAAFFARVQRQGKDGKKSKKGDPVVIALATTGEVQHPRRKAAATPQFLAGAKPELAAEVDRREVLVDWLVSADNPYFARSYVNRIWFHLLGKGIVDPVDDFRDSNPPSNPALLDALANDFVAKKFDVRHVIRTIMNSQTYQLSARTNVTNQKDLKYFSHTMPRLLTAEQLLDSLGQATEMPEFFKGMSSSTRAIHLVDGEGNHPFLKAFGQPPRQTPCEHERTSEVSLARALQMVNGPTINAMVANSKNRIGRLLKNRSDAEILRELYWASVSRGPTADEVREALEYVKNSDDRRKAWEDIQWALFNTREFLFRY